MRFVHAADLHLDSPLRGLERYEGAPVDRMRGATRRAFENLVELCIENDARLLLIAGDLYDGDWKDYATGLFFAAQMARLREAGVRVVWVRGNHDAASQLTKHLRPGSNVRELSVRRPETLVLEDLGVAVHGQGFPTRAVTNDIAQQYPAPVPGALNIGLLHTSVTGREGHEPYAPCSVDTLVGKGYDYWALGHVHTREVLHESPHVVFPGNLQGRHMRERGAKGATLVTTDGARITSVEHCALDVVRYVLTEVDAGDASSGDDVVDLARTALEGELERGEGRLLASRVVVHGNSRAHGELQQDPEQWAHNVRAAALDISSDGLWLEDVRLSTRPALQLPPLGSREDPLTQIASSIASIRSDEVTLAELLGCFADLRRKLPHELRDAMRLDDPAMIRDALEDVERMVFSQLLVRSEE